MKISLQHLKKIIRESISESDKDTQELQDDFDDEGRMAKSSMYHVSKRSKEIYDILNDDEQLPGWLQNKIAVVEDNMQTIYDYILYTKKSSKK